MKDERNVHICEKSIKSKHMLRSFYLMIGFTVGSYFSVLAQDQVLKESIDRGQQVYLANCMSCHMENGEGIEGTFPPLIKSEYVSGDTKRLIKIILEGQTGEITVNGKTYNMDMPAQGHLSDEEVADVLNYIRNSWDNKSKKSISPSDIKALR
jgi:nitrite reductase (NO-forming)